MVQRKRPAGVPGTSTTLSTAWRSGPGMRLQPNRPHAPVPLSSSLTDRMRRCRYPPAEIATLKDVDHVTIRPASDRSLLLSFGDEISFDAHLAVARLTRSLLGVRGILNLHPAY